jgi:hypothetical protein
MLHVEVITDMNISQLVINGNSLISIRKFWNRYYHDWDTSKLSDEKWIETVINQWHTNVNLDVNDTCIFYFDSDCNCWDR